MLTRAASGATFAVATYRNANGETPALARIVPTGDGGYILVGDKGVDRYQPVTESK